MLRVGKLIDAAGEQQLIKVKNLSAGGLMAHRHAQLPAIGEQVAGRAVVAEDPGDGRVDPRRHRRRSSSTRMSTSASCSPGASRATASAPRPPRLEIACKASVRVGKLYYSVDVHDISLGGMKVEPIEEYCVGKKVVVVVESLRPIKGEVRWYSDRRAGIVFDKPLEFDELAEWVGKRLELASLKASYQKH